MQSGNYFFRVMIIVIRKNESVAWVENKYLVNNANFAPFYNTLKM